MKNKRALAVARGTNPVSCLTLGCVICGLALAQTGGAATDPTLTLAINRSDQQVILSWFGSNGVPYQLQSRATASAWTNSGPALIGTGGLLFVTNPVTAQNESFYRVTRLPLISAVFSPATGILTITGDEQDNTIVVSRNVAGMILVNGGAVPVSGGVPTVANTALIQIFGRAGDDHLSLNESNGALPAANMFGEAGDDTLTGGSGSDILSGGTGSDTLHGRGGADQLFGGDGDDVLIGGDGNDQMFGENGNDRFIWNPGDDTDLNEGGDGIDTVEVNGGNGAETFTLTANGTRVRFDRVDPAPFALDIGTCENLVLNANGGNDSFSATGNLAPLIQIVVDGGEGDDTLLGSNGADLLIGGAGNDFVDGQQGNDVIFLGEGDDTFRWDPGDGSDVIEGQGGFDTLLFNGSGANEGIDLSANGSRLRFTRSVGNIVLDVAGIEAVRYNALGGADVIVVNDLSGTDVTAVTLDLSGTLGSDVGDSQPDIVILHGTSGVDEVETAYTAPQLTVSGLSASVAIRAADASDSLAVLTHAGDDKLDIAAVGDLTNVTIDAGPGNDLIMGSPRADVLIGGDDNDTIIGRGGDDVAFGGDGDDVFIWNPGDGSDILEGQAGNDVLIFNGSNASEAANVFANGGRVGFFRNVANVVLDCDDIEQIHYNALGGADSFTVGDLSGTDVTNVTVALSGLAGSGAGDEQPDTVTVNGTNGDDVIVVDGTPGNLSVLGLPAVVTVLDGEGNDDGLVINALGGADVVDASSLAAGAIKLSLNGGLGGDVLIGSPGDDVFTGGDGNDLLLGGAGNDTFVWNPGDDHDTIEGQTGSDTLLFNGNNATENITVSANGGRLRLFRDVASVVMDCNAVEVIHVNAAGAADTVSISDLTGTDVNEVRINLAALGGGGDAQPDNVIVTGTDGDDVVLVNGASGSASVIGLWATVSISGSEPANDRVTINVLAGDDVVDASGLAADAIALTANGGADNDTLIGGAGNDVLLGGEGDDVLIGGPGIDVLDGGPGDNVVIQ